MTRLAADLMRDTKLIAVSVLTLLGGGSLFVLSVAAYPRLTFVATVLLGLVALAVLISAR